MRRELVKMLSWGTVGVSLLAAGWISPQAMAQPIARRGHIWLPRSWGATPLSTVIHAQASYLASAGYFLEQAAIARRHRALAAKQEMENALQWVDTYFEMRERNRAWRARENPNHLVREKMHQEALRDQIENYLQNSLENDLTGKLNWLLSELSGPSLAYQYQRGDKTLAGSNLDKELGPRDIGHLRLTDGGHVGGHKLIFRPDDAKVLQTDWPRALRGPEFKSVRDHFERTRDAALEKLRKGQLSWEEEQALIEAIDRVTARFNEVYTREYRLQMQLVRPGTYSSEYKVGQRFLQSLAAGVFRALSTNDRSVFDESYKFTGDSVVDLVLYMYQNGLEFAPPESGDEAVYKNVYRTMRELYTSLAPEQAIPQGGGP